MLCRAAIHVREWARRPTTPGPGEGEGLFQDGDGVLGKG